MSDQTISLKLNQIHHIKIMKSFFFLFLSLVLVGAGCTASTPVTSVDDAVVEEDATLGEETQQVEEDEVSSEGKTEAVTEIVVDPSVNVTVPEAVVFNVDGFMFGYSLKELRVKKGQTVTVNFTSTGGMHDWVVDEFNATTAQVNTGATTSVTFVADKAGTFEYYCSVGQHRANGMVGNLMVE